MGRWVPALEDRGHGSLWEIPSAAGAREEEELGWGAGLGARGAHSVEDRKALPSADVAPRPRPRAQDVQGGSSLVPHSPSLSAPHI